MKIAIIMSVYSQDNPSYLKDSIESILEQSIDCDLYIYQDGILPIELEYYLEYYMKHPNIIMYKSAVNNGLAYALNFLIDRILEKKHKYEYIARMDSDDISLPTRIEKQAQFLNQNKDVDVLGTFCCEFGSTFALEEKRLPITHNELKNFSITRCPFIHPSVMFRCNVFEAGNRYPTHTSFTEDMAFWLELLYKKYKFHNIPEILLKYRLEENTVNRRSGLLKAKSEVSLRLGYMFLLNEFSIKNLLLIVSRYFFHLLPPRIMSLAYKHLR